MDSPRQKKNTRSSGDEDDDNENTSAIESNENEEIDSELSDSETRNRDVQPPAADKYVHIYFLFCQTLIIFY